MGQGQKERYVITRATAINTSSICYLFSSVTFILMFLLRPRELRYQLTVMALLYEAIISFNLQANSVSSYKLQMEITSCKTRSLQNIKSQALQDTQQLGYI